ncbi:hypothetical protein [Legionella shakespearei]|uniref:Interaptin n=1 Tax=Legionella shakespearei DSM 23087 TaxID=1122169 RepID=A0A0W0YK77_9GAMM|nr:hypothetical protein [Legionella shakespearei]KTD57255.1 interaptin [Legionella shakespearei DSM 23087]
MPNSSDIKNELTNRTLLGDRDAQIGALDALLLVDPTNTSEFRKALIAHQVFWKAQPYFAAAVFEDNEALLTVDTPLQELHALAAQQRVVLGLSEVDPEVLIKILSNNQDECRAYLASLEKLGSLKQAHGWQPDIVPAASIKPPPPPANSHTNVLSNEAIAAIKTEAANIHLSQLIESTKEHELLSAVLNAKTRPDFDAAIKKIGFPAAGNGALRHPLNEGQIKELKDSIASIEKAMLHNYIEHHLDAAQLKALDATEDLDKFKEGLNKIGITSTDWVEDEDLKDIKQWIRSRQFVLTVKESSQLEINCHQHLLNMFDTLPIDKQRDLLNKPQVLQKILQARDAETVGHYLGKGIEGVSSFLRENELNASYKGIHNAAVARALAGFDPVIRLDDTQVSKINEALLAANETPNVFTDVALYKSFVDQIRAQCGAVDAKTFNEAFNLNQAGTAFSVTTPVKDAIAVQAAHNKDLFTAYVLPEHAGHKQLLDVLLSLDKELSIKADQIKPIEGLFDQSKSVREFINSLISEPKPPAPALIPQVRSFKTRLLNEFSPALFDEIKQGLLKEQFKLASVDDVTKALTKVQKDLTDMQALHKPIVDNVSHFKPLEKVEPHHLYNPAFHGTAQVHAAEMKEKYQEFSNTCNDIVDQLRRNKNHLEDYLKSLPKDADLHASLPLAERKKIEALRKELAAELVVVNKNLEFYEKVQEKLSGEKGILQAIDEAKAGNKSYVFHAEGVTRRFSTLGKMNTLTKADSVPLPQNTAVKTGQQSDETKNFVLGEAIPEGQIAVFDVVKTSYNSSKAVEFESRGRFTHDPSPPAAVTSKGDKITKTPGGKFEIIEFPKQTVPPPKQGSAEDVRLTKARIEFSMTMAAEILASMEGPPTKSKPLRLYGANEEEMRYLWTALVVLGEKDPKMKFGPEAIKLDKYGDNNFDPSQEMGRFWGYSNESLYTKFKQDQFKTSVEKKSEDLAEVTQDKFGKKDEQENMDAKVIKANESFKKDLQQVRAKAKQDTAEHGPAVSPKRPGM